MSWLFDKRRRPYLQGETVLSLPGLSKTLVWPENALSQLIRGVLKGEARLQDLPEPVLEGLGGQGVLRQSPEQEGSLPGVTILDGLSWSEIAALPDSGPFLFWGDPEGGFYAPVTACPCIPCPRCLLARYLAGRRASQALWEVISQGETVHFLPWGDGPRTRRLVEEHRGEEVLIFGRSSQLLSQVLPLPGCSRCWERLSGRTEYDRETCLSPSLMSPVNRVWEEPPRCSVRLPGMRWLCGHPTVGGGSAWQDDPELCRRKAVHEAMERYGAHFEPPGGVSYRPKRPGAEIPIGRTLLTEAGAVSTGLACREELENAIEDGVREVCERDALARFWLKADAGLPGASLLERTEQEGLSLEFYQLESFRAPTVVARATASGGGYAFGSACGPLEQARRKALEECWQNVRALENLKEPSHPSPAPSTFVEHALTYWLAPERFPKLVFHDEVGVRELEAEVLHCDLTPRDLKALGLRVVRVRVPGLLYTPMSHCDWPEVLGPDTPPPNRPHPFA